MCLTSFLFLFSLQFFAKERSDNSLWRLTRRKIFIKYQPISPQNVLYMYWATITIIREATHSFPNNSCSCTSTSSLEPFECTTPVATQSSKKKASELAKTLLVLNYLTKKKRVAKQAFIILPPIRKNHWSAHYF